MSSVVAYVAESYGAGRARNACTTEFGTVQIVSARVICKNYEDSNSHMTRMAMMKLKRIKNAVKDIQRGSGNRVAEGASVLGEGRDPADFAHVATATPLQTKTKEFAAAKAERLGTELAPDIDKAREGRTTRLRRAKDVRPL